MKIKSKPAKPKRLVFQQEEYVYYGDTVQTIVDKLNKLEVALDNAKIVNSSYYECGLYIQYTIPEPENEYAQRLAKYETKLAVYEIWLKENQDLIAAELVKREEKKKLALQEEKEKHFQKIAKLNKKIAQL